MPRPSIAEAMKIAETARAEVSAHERECSIRYGGIKDAIDALTKKQEQAVSWTIATLVAMVGGALGMIFILVTGHH